MARVQSALGDMMSAAGTVTAAATGGNRRHTAQPPPPGFMDLSGYALHQRLRTAPGAEMYVTGMHAKVMPPRSDPGSADSSASGTGDGRSWARVDGCQYDPTGNTLEARMRFGRTIMVSGSVRLLYGGGGGGGYRGLPAETGCDMTLRLRPRAGLGFTAAPLTMPEKSPPNRLTATPTMTIRTTATFIDPDPPHDDPAAAYVSVHSYNCVGGAAGFPGNREHAVASSDRYEQIMSAEDGSDERLTGGGGGGDGDFDVDLDDDTDFKKKFGDMRSNIRRPSPLRSPLPSSAPPSPPTTADVSAAVTHLFVPAGFVAPSPPSPEPRIRRIQYHTKPPQRPLVTVAAAHHHQQTQDQLLMEMEDVFVRGVRSLLAKHMERTLQPVLKDSLMANMGYTVSYG